MHSITVGGQIYTPSKVLCAVRNYPAHRREMGAPVAEECEPILFFKPPTAIASEVTEHSLPARLGVIEHEVELCVLLGRGGSSIPAEEVMDHVAAYAVGIDFTARERQAAAKAAGLPWELAKAFDGSAVFGAFVPASHVPDPSALTLRLTINDVQRQFASTGEALHSIAELLSFISRFTTLEAGDILMTGTPQGVGPVVDGDLLKAEISGLPTLRFLIHRR